MAHLRNSTRKEKNAFTFNFQLSILIIPNASIKVYKDPIYEHNLKQELKSDCKKMHIIHRNQKDKIWNQNSMKLYKHHCTWK